MESSCPPMLSLYGGNSGIALFLGYLGHITGEERYTALARLTLKTIRHEITRSKNGLNLLRLAHLLVWGAPLYLFTHLGVLWNKPTLLQQAREFVALLPP